MNRIYQGKVSAVEIADGEDEQGEPKWKKLDDWQAALWRHHELFQDAVNYYLVALASLADPEHAPSRLIKDLRTRVGAAWAEFPRSVGAGAISLRQSIGKWIGLPREASLEHAFEIILKGNDAKPAVLTQSLGNLLDGLLDKSGDSKIRNNGRQEAPKFLWKDTDANFQSEYSRKNLARLNLILTLHGLVKGDLKEFGPLDLATASKRSNRKPIQGEPARKKLIQIIEKLKDAGVLTMHIANNAKAVLEKLHDNQFLEIPPYEAGGASKEKSLGIPLLLLGKQLGFPDWCVDALRQILVVPTKWEQRLVDAQQRALDDGDPLEISRGSRGFVFRAFTALPDWNPPSAGKPVWKEFDIAAFKEALKSLNQFNQKTQERVEAEEDLRGQLAILLGSKIEGWKPRKSESGEEEPVPEPLDPQLFQLARNLEKDLTEDLADTVVGETRADYFGKAVFSYREGEWRISSAALRGYRDISEEWNKLHAKRGKNLTSTELEEVVKNYQREEKNKKSVGSIPLFLRLCEKKYWPLWLAHEQESEEPASGQSFLHAMASFHLEFRDLQRSLEPINLTPAEPRHSRRLYMFSDLKDRAAKVSFVETDDGFAVVCAIAIRADNGEVREQRVRLHYSAKRLLRDELQGGVESRWLQPMTRALGLKMPETKTPKAFESAVSLMPDFARPANPYQPDRLRFLLNFPVTLDPAWIHSGLGKASAWKGQFNGTRDKNLHLHWPATIKGRGAESPWWKHSKIITQGFTCVSVDLGQRTAGAWALLRVTCSDPRDGSNGTRRPVREIGFDGKRTWFAEVLTTGIIRLPGEDQKIIDNKAVLEVERFGKAGRNALESEWKQGKTLASDLLADSPEAWVGKSFTEKSFPEQNDALIALANRRLSRLNTFHRWSCFNPDRPEVTGRCAGLINKLSEELGHWQDAEVTTWKELIEKNNFAGFRSAAGTAFESLRQELGAHLIALANRVVPLRNRSWKWERSKDGGGQGVYGELLDTGARLSSQPTWIRGQRGLSLFRIGQLENLRRLFLRYNRSFDREPGKPAEFGRADFGRRSGEPCRRLLDKIDRMKAQRINQTAHLILAQALGVRLKAHKIDPKEREARDIHGEYEQIPGREPVDFIIIENLDRYLTSQGRSPSENSHLMKWAHRAVRDKIKMLAEEPFGIPLVEAAAAYSSRFCAVTSAAGARCEERAHLDDYHKESLGNRARRLPKPGQPEPADFETLLYQFTRLEKLNADLQRVPNEGKKKGQSLFSLFLPKPGGPLFLAINGKMPKQADINAAINVGLRAIAAPNALSILHKIRIGREDGSFRPLVKNAREKAAFKSKTPIVMSGKVSGKLRKARNPNFFFDAGATDCFDRASLKLADLAVPLVSAVGLWSAVNESFVKRLIAINDVRLARWTRRLGAAG